MRRAGVVSSMLAFACLIAGCATSLCFTDATRGEGPRGYVEFYVVPGTDEAFFNALTGTPLITSTFDVKVFQLPGNDRKSLGVASGGFDNGRRLRVACAPGKHSFRLVCRLRATDCEQSREVEVVVRDNMVTPVGIQIAALKSEGFSQTYGKGSVQRSDSNNWIPSAIGMKVAAGQPQAYYDFHGDCSQYRRGGFFVSIEARSPAELARLKEDVRAALDAVGTRRGMSADQYETAFRQHFSQTESGRHLAEGVVIRLMYGPKITLTGQTFE